VKRRLRFRPRASQLETYAKRHSWKRLALVGISDADIMGRLVAACRAVALVIVPEWPAKSQQPSERIKQQAREAKLRKLCSAYDRVTLLEPGAVPEGVFDAAVLLGMGDDLADVGAVYAGLVRDGGWLMGDDARDAGTRAQLAAVAPGWERLDDGLWCVRVKREDRAGQDNLATLADADGPGMTAAGDDAQALEEEHLAHDPIHSGPDVDEPTIAPKRRGGRPKGAKNKAKVAE
jgi:hypothetical protein